MKRYRNLFKLRNFSHKHFIITPLLQRVLTSTGLTEALDTFPVMEYSKKVKMIMILIIRLVDRERSMYHERETELKRPGSA